MHRKEIKNCKILYIGTDFNDENGCGRISYCTYKLFKTQFLDSEIFCHKNSQGKIETKYKDLFPSQIIGINNYLKHFTDYYYNVTTQKNLSWVLDDFKPDLIHLHSPWSTALTCAIFKPIIKRNIPVIMTLHDTNIICPIVSLTKNNGNFCSGECGGWNKIPCIINNCGINYERSIRFAAATFINKLSGFEKYVSKFITPTDILKNIILKQNKNINEDRIVTINNFIPEEEFNNIKPNYDNQGYFLYVGRLTKIKGVEYLLEAMKNLPSDIKLHIAGKGDEEGVLRNFVNDNSMNNITFLNTKNREELMAEYQNCIAVIVPSTCYEAFGLVNIEAFLNGKPVIASDRGGIPEVVDNNVNGLIFRAKDVNHLQECILKYKNDNNQVIQHGKNGNEKVKTKYLEEKYFNNLKTLYEEVLHNAK